MFWGIAIPATVGEVLFVAGKLGYSDTAFLGVLIAIFGSAISTLVISKLDNTGLTYDRITQKNSG